MVWAVAASRNGRCAWIAWQNPKNRDLNLAFALSPIHDDRGAMDHEDRRRERFQIGEWIAVHDEDVRLLSKLGSLWGQILILRVSATAGKPRNSGLNLRWYAKALLGHSAANDAEPLPVHLGELPL